MAQAARATQSRRRTLTRNTPLENIAAAVFGAVVGVGLQTAAGRYLKAKAEALELESRDSASEGEMEYFGGTALAVKDLKVALREVRDSSDQVQNDLEQLQNGYEQLQRSSKQLQRSVEQLRGSTEPLQSNAEPLQRHAEQLHGVATTSFASATCSVKQLQNLYEQLSLSNSRLKAQMYLAGEPRG